MGRAIQNALEKTALPISCRRIWAMACMKLPSTGKASKLLSTAISTSKWPLMTMNSSVAICTMKRATALSWALLVGSKNDAKFRPICKPTTSPATSTAAITRRTAKPTDKPTTTCCTSVPSAWGEAILTTV